MRIEYEATVTDKISKAITLAENTDRKIKCIYLTEKEWSELIKLAYFRVDILNNSCVYKGVLIMIDPQCK